MDTHKTIRLSKDDLLMGFKKDDEIVVSLTKEPTSGSLVVLRLEDEYLVARFENIDNKKFLWPPRGIDTKNYSDIIFGEAVELIRELK